MQQPTENAPSWPNREPDIDSAIAKAKQGRLEEASDDFRAILRQQPGDLNAHDNLGTLLRMLGRSDEAIEHFREAIRLRPSFAEAHNNLGIALAEKRQLVDAIASFRTAAELEPGYANAHANLGNALRIQGRLDEAIAALREAIRLNPNHGEAHNNLGIAYKDSGQLDQAILEYEQARRSNPQNPIYHGNLLHALVYHPGYDARAIYEHHQRWEQEHAPEASQRFAYPNDPSPARQLRVGYVSPDFSDHVVGQNVWPLMRNHDHAEFEITLYSNSVRSDRMTEQFESSADRWHTIAGWPDGRVVEQVRRDGIDILADLALHTARNRLAVFAHKPAPVQLTFAGYPGTTGLSAIDYRLTDPHLDPLGLDDACYSEESYRLPHSFWCFDPQSEEPAVGALPASKNGFVTFGCLNNFCKTNDDVFNLWAQVLREAPKSRLVLLAKEGSHRQRTVNFFADKGIGAGRVSFFSPQPRHQYLALYNEIDIGLDTLPYNGHSTSLDSFWMGVPVVTLIGKTVVGRAGLSQLTNLGLPELAADTPKRFVETAVTMAGDFSRLTALRSSMRRRMKSSPLMDAERFARGIEQAYRTMWQKWCATVADAAP